MYWNESFLVNQMSAMAVENSGHFIKQCPSKVQNKEESIFKKKIQNQDLLDGNTNLKSLKSLKTKKMNLKKDVKDLKMKKMNLKKNVKDLQKTKMDLKKDLMMILLTEKNLKNNRKMMMMNMIK
jgi:predicted RNase H-like nuclease (RuvC/YqgF family)